MLKRLAILAVLVLATATAGLLEGQSTPLSTPKDGIAKTDSGQDGKKQSKATQTQKNPEELTSADVEVEPAPCDETCQQGRRNLEIQGKIQRYTATLAIVGMFQVVGIILQAWLLWKTWQKIGRQAELMDGQLSEMKTQAGHVGEQTKILGDSVGAAKASAKAANDQIEMMKSKERARITIKILPLQILDFDIDGKNSVNVQIENIGQTHAYNVKSQVTARVVVPGFERWDVDDLDDFMLPKVIRTDTPPIDTDLPFIFIEEWMEDIRENKVKLIIELRGIITYEDVFGDKHSTRFSYDMEVDRWTPLPRGELVEVKSYYGWRPTHSQGDNDAS